jgi:L-2-hydroxyglutarate oxidase LhgO
MSYQSDITIIGAGVVGLAIAARVAGKNREVFVLEKNESFGLETSSRNSGVIHSGIYYPNDSLKARLCVAGRNILYELCRTYGIGHRRIGKLIVAADDEETGELQALFETGKRNGIEDLQMLSKQEIKKLEPNIDGVAAVMSPSTGIIDSHALMKHFVSGAISAELR